MSGRRTSTVSILSSRPRKFSADRHQIQAELSARIEEGRSARPPLTREEDVTLSFRQDFFSKQPVRSTTFSDADAFPSPLEVHPGRKWRGESLIDEAYVTTDPTTDVVKPWPEPSFEKQEDIERRTAVFERTETNVQEPTPEQVRVRYSAPDLHFTNNPVKRLVARVRGHSAIKHSLSEGLRVPSGVITAHTNALVTKQSVPWEKRKDITMFEYDIGKGQIYSCNACNSFSSKTKLEQHFAELEKVPAIRIMRVCNSEDVVDYLDDSFAISPHGSYNEERAFRKWMQLDRDQRGAANMTIRWRPGYDTHRGMICCAFGLDFGPLLVDDDSIQDAALRKAQLATQGSKKKIARAMPRKRIAMYMQRTPSSAVPGPKLTRFSSRIHKLPQFAAEDTLIICEYSSDEVGTLSNSAHLMALSPVTHPPDRIPGAAGIMASALRHVFEELAWQWDKQIRIIHKQHAEVEDVTYARPADASQAQRVWAMSERLHSMQKLINRHLELIETFKDDFKTFAELDEHQDWLDDILEDLKGMSNLITSYYIEPLEHLIDLMYKSISIRDSSLSLELNQSLWRLSWITFIFLPMTFLVGFFGMNVGTFEVFPSIKWYFVALIPLVFIVFACWLGFREYGRRQKLQREVLYGVGDIFRTKRQI